MKNLTFIFISIMFVGVLNAQTNIVSDQNPNAKAAYEKYAVVANDYILKQGTTSQQTYVAIDPMEEKRIRKNIRKDYRAMRPLWRHQERMERAKHTSYVYGNPYRWSSYQPVLGRSFTSFGLGYFAGSCRF
ncbi:hypothetical protein [Wenyingzhuangia sp. IMCC45467]